MEMDSSRRRRLLLMTLGLVLAVVAGLAAFMLGQGGRTAAPDVEMASVVVAAREIPSRATLTVEDLVVRQVPEAAVLAQAYRPEDLQALVGRVNSVAIYSGQQITPNLFATAAADQPFRIIDEGEEVTLDSPFWRAASIAVPRARAVGGEIRAGQRVDLFVTVELGAPLVPVVDPETGQVVYQAAPEGVAPAFNPETGETEGVTSGRSTKITIPDLLVLQAEPAEGMYILKVDLHQAEQIAHINQIAPDAYSMVLRPEEDTRPIATEDFGSTTDRIIMEYLYAVPLLVDLDELLGFPIGPILPAPSPAPGETPVPEPSPEEPEESPAPSP